MAWCGVTSRVVGLAVLLAVLNAASDAAGYRSSRGSTATFPRKQQRAPHRAMGCLHYGHSCLGAHGKRSSTPGASPSSPRLLDLIYNGANTQTRRQALGAPEEEGVTRMQPSSTSVAMDLLRDYPNVDFNTLIEHPEMLVQMLHQEDKEKFDNRLNLEESINPTDYDNNLATPREGVVRLHRYVRNIKVKNPKYNETNKEKSNILYDKLGIMVPSKDITVPNVLYFNIGKKTKGNDEKLFIKDSYNLNSKLNLIGGDSSAIASGGEVIESGMTYSQGAGFLETVPEEVPMWTAN